MKVAPVAVVLVLFFFDFWSWCGIVNRQFG